jgi:hypothetical protein
MRLLFGVMLGVGLTVGGAYVGDAMTASPTAGVERRPMVNWDVVNQNLQDLSQSVKEQWTKLTSR